MTLGRHELYNIASVELERLLPNPEVRGRVSRQKQDKFRVKAMELLMEAERMLNQTGYEVVRVEDMPDVNPDDLPEFGEGRGGEPTKERSE